MPKYDSDSGSGLMGYAGTADDAGGYLIGMFSKGEFSAFLEQWRSAPTHCAQFL